MDYIRTRRDGTHLWVIFDRPDKLNVLHPGDLVPLRETVERLEDDITAVIFTGAGSRSFSAGMNLEAFIDLRQPAAATLIGRLAAVMRAVRQVPVVTVAVVNGYCLGAGFELALACDVRVVATSAAFGLPEIKVGIPSVIDAALLQSFVGMSRAREMILTGDLYHLADLPPYSIANVVADPAQLGDATARLLSRVAGHTRTVTAAQRRLFDIWLNNGLNASVDLSIDEFAGTFAAVETHRQIAEHYRRIVER